jgi:hypothetical protein
MGGNPVGGLCPTCGAEYRPGFDTCADDRTPLLPGPAPEPIPEPETFPPETPPPHTRWIELTSLPAHQAQLLAGRLESEGIDARTDPPEVGSWPGYPYGGLGQRAVKVLVPEGHAKEALAVLRELEHG